MAPSRAPPSAPWTCSSFKVSRNSAKSVARAMPSRRSKASAPASDPAIDAVWLSAAACARVERPVFKATIGVRLRRASCASASNWAMESKPSMCSPRALTRSSSSKALASAETPSCAWLPAVAM